MYNTETTCLYVSQKFQKWTQTGKQLLNMANNIEYDVDGEL